MKPIFDASYWNKRYLEEDTSWDIGHISTPLKEYFDQLKDLDAEILIPGAGNAYEAEYLVRFGFRNVQVCDIAPIALENLKNRVPGMDENHLLLKDFFQLKGKEYDLIIEQTFFCALEPSLRRDYFRTALDLLKPGGRLAGLLFDDALNKDRPPFGGSKEEYLKYIPSEFDIEKFENCYNSIEPRAGREIFMNLRKKRQSR